MRNRFTMSGVLLIIAGIVFCSALACPADAARRRPVTPRISTAQYLKYTCWIADGEADRLARVSSWIAEHRYDIPAVVTPPMVTMDSHMRASAALFVYMRRETQCVADDALAGHFTRNDARRYYEAHYFLVEVSRHLDAVYPEGW